MDRIPKARRSWNMSQIRGKNTKPEIQVRSLLHALGYRFTLHSPKLPGHPDIVLPKLRKIIFVHGCFWHRHSGCKFAYTPKTRINFWQEKFRQNVRRDRTTKKTLKELGWQTKIVWECETRKKKSLTPRLLKFLRS